MVINIFPHDYEFKVRIKSLKFHGWICYLKNGKHWSKIRKEIYIYDQVFEFKSIVVSNENSCIKMLCTSRWCKYDQVESWIMDRKRSC